MMVLTCNVYNDVTASNTVNLDNPEALYAPRYRKLVLSGLIIIDRFIYLV